MGRWEEDESMVLRWKFAFNSRKLTNIDAVIWVLISAAAAERCLPHVPEQRLQFQYALLDRGNATSLINLPLKCLQSARKGCAAVDLKAFRRAADGALSNRAC